MESFAKSIKGLGMQPTDIVSTNTSYMLMDFALGGGISEGQWIEIFGAEGVGKTSNALCMSSYFLEIMDNMYLMYLDIEKATAYERITEVFFQDDVKIDEETGVIFINGKERGILSSPDTFEQIDAAFDAFAKYCKKNELHGIIVWDSLVTAVSEKVIKDGKEKLAYRATMIQDIIDKYGTVFSKIPITQLVINQTRQKIKINMFESSKGDGEMADDVALPGGNAHKFKAFQTLFLARGKKWEFPTTTPFLEGRTIRFLPTKNKLGAPKREFKMVLIYEIGFSSLVSLLEYLRDKKLLKGQGLSSIKYGKMKTGMKLDKFADKVSTDEKFAKEFFDYMFDILITDFKAYAKLHRFNKDDMLKALMWDAKKVVTVFNDLKGKGVDVDVSEDADVNEDSDIESEEETK